MFELKTQIGDNLYTINLPDGIVVPFRLLTMAEFNNCRTSFVIGIIPQQDIYDHIFRTCVLNKGFVERPDDLRAGVLNLVARLVFYMSGPNSLDFMNQLLNVERQVAQTFESQMKIWVCRAFPGYTMDMLSKLTFPQVIKLFAEAEALLLMTNQIEKPFSLVNQTEIKQKGFSIHEAMKEAAQLRSI